MSAPHHLRVEHLNQALGIDTSGRPGPSCPSRCQPGRIDHVTSAGCPATSLEPRRITHGFQYLRIGGHAGDLTPADVTGVVVLTDLARTR